MANNFGFRQHSSSDATAWLRLKGVASPQVVALALLAFTLIPVGDAVIVFAQRGRPAVALGVHGATAILMLIGATLLLTSV